MTVRSHVIWLLVLVAAVAFAPGRSVAGTLPPPTGPVLLKVFGAIDNTTDGTSAQFDRAALEALGMHKITTTNPFVVGVHTFEGVRLTDLLARVGAHGRILKAHALDDFSPDIPIEDAKRYGVVLALKWDGKAIPVRGKGPIWMIYPADSYSDTDSAKISARMVWQLQTLTVVP